MNIGRIVFSVLIGLFEPQHTNTPAERDSELRNLLRISPKISNDVDVYTAAALYTLLSCHPSRRIPLTPLPVLVTAE